MIKTKSAEVRAEVDEKEGFIIAYASTFDREPDSYGDIVAKGAFADSLKNWEQRTDSIPVLFGHRTDDPLMNIGVVTDAKEDERGLRVEIQLDLDNERGAYTYKLLKEGRISKLSFAFSVLDSAEVELENGIIANELRKMDIYEVSIVPIPANQHTEVIEVRAAESELKAKPTQEVDERSNEVQSLLKRIDDILYK